VAELGQVIEGRYKLLRLLGQGGMGAVYEAEHLHIAKKVALKFLKPELCARVEFTRRFLREAQAAAATGHKSIVEVHDISQTPEGELYLVMEYLEGQSLATLLEQRPVLETSLAAYIACHVLSALAAAHERGIVHRDVKPENIFLQDTGQPWPEIKLLDFGASKIQEGVGPMSGRLTATGIVLGTPYYMSPEQARGELDVDHRADIYATGVVLYENLTGQLPFSGANYNAVMANVISAPVTPPSMIRPDVPAGLERVVLKAMERSLVERYGSAVEMLADLLPFIEEKATATIALPRGVTWERLTSMRVPRESLPVAAVPAGSSSRFDTTRAEFSTPVRSRVPLWVVLVTTAFVVAALAVGGTLLAVDFGRPDEPRATASGPVHPTAAPVAVTPPAQPQVLPPPVTPAALDASVEVAHDAAAADAAPELPAKNVTVTLTGLPDGARIYVGGDPVTGPVLTVARGVAPVEIRVEAAGRRPWQREVLPDQDIIIPVSLEREDNAGERHGARDGSARDHSKRHGGSDQRRDGRGGLKRNPFDF
jgi:serine/threonine-protein kinase